MNKVHPIFQTILSAIAQPACARCDELDEVHGPQCPEHPDYDPTPWCSGCGAMRKRDCHCGGPIDPMD